MILAQSIKFNRYQFISNYQLLISTICLILIFLPQNITELTANNTKKLFDFLFIGKMD